jgi:hypothetical protein
MTRIGTGLGAKVRTYTARVSPTFRQLESARTDDSVVPTPGTVVILSATNHVRTLDSAYTQGVLIRNPSSTVSVFVAGIEGYDDQTCASPGLADTAWEIPPGQSQRFDVRDGTGLCIGVLASTLDVRVVGN